MVFYGFQTGVEKCKQLFCPMTDDELEDDGDRKYSVDYSRFDKVLNFQFYEVFSAFLGKKDSLCFQ